MALTSENILRVCRFSPYRRGMGPVFKLTTWDTNQRDHYGKSILGYRLTMRGTCGHPETEKVTCGRCHRSWCDTCYPAPSAMCQWCNGGFATKWGTPIETVLFEGEDFGCSPCHAVDSDATVEGIMSFLTLRPGDTDAEYFESYTQAQLNYCAEHAEALRSEVDRRFCCRECGACAKRNRAGYCERCARKEVRS